ncbi:AAA family ATPase [Pseudoalteromonas sp. MMG010]|uniref:chromosome segregation SMC family protein n=1 Tax=Pseudoalteromonas sp. MMG010 TaxID=2822685 RepID=UPI001B3A403B|nr:AAA family ATPase [Pseudoalteromonas sp. MMG010]MBQ4834543.1 AAA family ATPase [Pseudoalteromonas sp. MMG010]
MRLSTIKLAGFKSFVEPTKIPFPDQMTCVVGPNGCGKSNVIDAVRWVLGESSAKNLRGDAMTDVIFNGSTNRKAISQASVELIFDNTQGRLPNTFADRNQVAIKRLVSRDGQSFYYLNGSKCRKRDITDIFLGTGLGPRSYAIIEQGMISRLIESKPQELRVFLEEAAGVSKYKERRKETQTRIKSTRENTERLLDVRKELQTQLNKLAVQSIDAKKYRELKAQERTLKAQIAVLKWQGLHQQQLEKSKKITQLNKQIAFFETAHLGHDDVLASLETQLQTQQDKLSDAQHQQHKIHTELTRAEQQRISNKQQQNALKQNLMKLEQRQIQADEEKEQQQRVCQQLSDALEQIGKESVLATQQEQQLLAQVMQSEKQKQHDIDIYQTQSQGYQTLCLELQSAKNQLTQTEQTLAHLNEQQAQVINQLNELDAQQLTAQLTEQQKNKQAITTELAVKQTQLKQIEETVSAHSQKQQQIQQQVQQSTQQCNELKASISGLNSSVGIEQSTHVNENLFAQLEVEPGFEMVVEHALGWLAHLTLQPGEAQNSVWPSDAKIEDELLPHSVAHKVKGGVYPQLLHAIAYHESADTRLLKNNPQFIAVINKQGEITGRNWHLKNDTNEQNSVLIKHKKIQQKAQQLEQQQQHLAQLQFSLDEVSALHNSLLDEQEQLKYAIHELAQRLAVANSRFDMMTEHVEQHQLKKSKLSTQNSTYDAQIEQLKTQLSELRESYEATSLNQQSRAQQLAQANAQQQKSTDDYNRLSKQLTQFKTTVHQQTLAEEKARSDWQLGETTLAHLSQECLSVEHTTQDLQQQLAELLEPELTLCDEIAQYLAQQDNVQQQLDTLHAEVAKAKSLLSDKQTRLKDSQSDLQLLQAKLQKLTIEEQSLLIKADAALAPLAELKQSLEDILSKLPKSINLAQWQSKLSNINNELINLGAVNLAAIEEFEQAQQRSDYLDNQLEDLSSALSTLETAINKIDKETKTRFKATFDQVNHDFGTLFPKVFGGGSAYLELTSDDLLESGVSIMARPPGKKNSTIHLLSGGEKALSALSLVFSIFRLNPAPFCMLDEVDAPLDDANVVRFCRLVEEMSQSVQFIYISHNKIAMEMAGRLTGVTMAEPGVSRMVAVDIEQAVQLAHT